MFAEDKESVQFLKDETVKTKLANAKKLSEVSADAYDAIFYIGGHGPVIDLPTDETNIKLAANVSTTTAHTSKLFSLPSSSTMLARSLLPFAMALRMFLVYFHCRLI